MRASNVLPPMTFVPSSTGKSYLLAMTGGAELPFEVPGFPNGLYFRGGFGARMSKKAKLQAKMEKLQAEIAAAEAAE